jgi:hypothetical protein
LIVNNVTAQSVSLLKTTHLKNYPSASGIDYNDGNLYIMGDDATHLLVLDTAHIPIDSVTIVQNSGNRISYTIKPDLESLSIGQYKRHTYLIATPSFSSDNRNTFYIFPLDNIKKPKTFTTPAPIRFLKDIGIKEPNLEGAAIIHKHVVVSNRANIAQPVNYLINIPVRKRSLKRSNTWKKSTVTLPATSHTIGFSGLEYWPANDQLFFTASTEITTSATADGEIGESYLGYFNNYSKKIGQESASPDKLINLSSELQIGNQKIEGICIESQMNNVIILHLVTDNDDGQSTVYKVKLML